MQTDLERNSCMLCGEIWNSTNLIKTELKGHQLRMCPECASDFDSYVKDKIIAKLEKIKGEIQGLIDFEESCCGNATLGYSCLRVINESIEAIRGKNIEKENKDMENNKAGWTEYKDIKDTLVSLLDKGYNKGMIQTVLEQIEEEKDQ